MCAGNQAVSREEELLKQGANMLRQRLGRNHAEDIEGSLSLHKRTDKAKGDQRIGGDYGKPSEGLLGLKEEGQSV